jgi:hypothetical protein
MLAEEMGLSLFTNEESAPDESPAEGEEIAEVSGLSEAEENFQMAALAWAHDEETDIETVLLPALEDGSWRTKVRVYEIAVFGLGELLGFTDRLNEYKRLIGEASVTIAKSRRSSSGDDSPGE